MPSASAQWETLACIGFTTNERTILGLLTSLLVAFLILYIRAVKLTRGRAPSVGGGGVCSF